MAAGAARGIHSRLLGSAMNVGCLSRVVDLQRPACSTYMSSSCSGVCVPQSRELSFSISTLG